MGTGRPFTWLAALSLLASTVAWGDPRDDRAASSAAIRVLVEQSSHYPERWCIDTYLASRRNANYPRTLVTRLPAPGRSISSIHEYSGEQSLWDRLSALPRMQIATLWQGRHRSLVLGFQDGGYFGFSFRPMRQDTP